MAEHLPEAIPPYANISAKAFQHPADRAATAALHSVPMLDTLVRRLIEWRYERALRQVYLGDSLRVGERQLPELWTAHTSAMKVLDMPDTYDVYVSTGVWGGAQTIGAGRPLIVVDSQLLRIIDHDERRALIGHELGHILSDHVLYATALGILIGLGGNLPFVLGLPFRAVRAVLLEWYRAAELSCDRAATLAVRDPQIVCRLLMATAAGLPSSDLDLDAFIAQAMEYRSWDDPTDRVRRFFNELGQTHANAVSRVSEVLQWVQGGEYDRIIRGEYRRRDEPSHPREEAGEAVEFYAERFRAIFRDLGDNLGALGSQVGGMAEQVGGVAEQLADWIRGRAGGASGREGDPD